MPEHCASFPTRTAAKEWAHQRESELKNCHYFPHDSGKKTFATFADLYIAHYLPKNPKAFSKQKQLMLYRKSKLGSYYISHISPSLIAQHRDELLSQITKRHKLRFHDLRHTAASHLAMNGASTLEIAAILGHKTLAMVKRYCHISTSATAQILQRLNNAIFGVA
jgi:site-specific recombinase XerD